MPPPLFVECGMLLGLVPLLEFLFKPMIFFVDEFFSILKLLVVGIIFIRVLGRPTELTFLTIASFAAYCKFLLDEK